MIHQRDDGHLECDKHAGKGYLTWCTHVADFVAAGRDAELIHPVDSTVYLQVPMLPAAVNLFQPVQLEPLVARAQGICVIEFEMDGQAFQAGHIMPGEGRAVIRENLIQWMIPQSPPAEGATVAGGWTCTSSLHGWAQMSRLDSMKSDKYTAWLMEQWCMMVNSMCTVCYKKFLDIGDVIPTGT